MQTLKPSHRLGALLILFVSISLACAPSISLPEIGSSEPELVPTFTPLPTFTATAPADVAVSIPPTPTITPTPLPTNTPEPPPTEPPPPTETPEPEPTEPPAQPVQQQQAAEPPPTEPPPPPPAEPPPPANGVVGSIEFREGRNTYGAGEKVFVRISAENVGTGLSPFGVLGLTTSDGRFQTSWSDGTIPAGQTFTHEDGVDFQAPGEYKMWLSICFSPKDECGSPEANWERFEPGLDVIVQ